MKKVVLFDIDSTLVKTRPIGVIMEIIRNHFDLDSSKSKVYGEGKTYREIIYQRLEEQGLENPDKHENFEKAVRDCSPYEAAIKEGIAITEKLPFAEDLLKQLDEEGHILGLITGNPESTSKVKLGFVDLWKYFKFGGFGSDVIDRAGLVDLAIKDAKEKLNLDLSKDNLIIVGDTVRDVWCARNAGVEIIAVATGKYSMEDLKKENPNYLFKDLSNIEEIMGIIRK